MNFDNKISHIFPGNVASLREENSIASQNNSFYSQHYQSTQAQHIHNASTYSTDSEQTFRQSRVPSPPKETSPKLYSEINRRLSASKISHSPYHNASPGRNTISSSSLNCSPMKKKINAEMQMQSKSPLYLPLAEKFSLTKEELSEKNKELQEMKVQNIKLASEVKSYRDKENKLLGSIENKLRKFAIDLTHLSYMDITNKYQELLAEYKQSLLHSVQMEDLLKNETLRNEEQRAYINVLKQKIGADIPSSPYLQKKTDEINSSKLDQRVSELVEPEIVLKEIKNNADKDQKGEELIKAITANIRFGKEKEGMEKEKEKEKEKESLLENLKEREVMINELTQENGRLSQEVIKYGKALSEINQKVATKMKDYDSLKGYVGLLKKEVDKQKKNVVLLECDVKEKDERLKGKWIKNSSEKEGSSDLEEVRKEKDILERKVNILAERIAELKEIETKWNKLSSGKEKDKVDSKETLNLKEEINKLEKKVESLVKENNALNGTKEELYQMISKSEAEIELLKRKLKEKGNVLTEVESKDKTQDDEIVSFLQEEVKIKQEEIEKLKGFIFNDEVKELINEGVEATREMFSLEKNMYQKNRPVGRREEGVRKIKESLDSIKAKRKSLEEELFELWSCEKKKYENLSKLQQKNFQLQNEVSRLMNELEINFSKYDGTSSNYTTVKQLLKRGQLKSENEESFSKEIQRGANSRANFESRNNSSINQLNNLPISADSSKIRKRRPESEERI